jgi:hypothetical protein
VSRNVVKDSRKLFNFNLKLNRNYFEVKLNGFIPFKWREKIRSLTGTGKSALMLKFCENTLKLNHVGAGRSFFEFRN